MPETVTPPPAPPVKKNRPYYDDERFKPWTTPKELEEYDDIVDKVFHRKPGQGKARDNDYYRVLNIFPEYTKSTGEDLVDQFDANGEFIEQGFNYVVRVAVESYREEPMPAQSIRGGSEIGKSKPVNKIITGSMTLFAREFLEKFQEK